MTTVVPGQYGVPAWIIILLVAVAIIIVIGTLVHEAIHIATALALGASIHAVTFDPRHSRWRYVLGDVHVEFKASTRVARVVAIAPTITGLTGFAAAWLLVDSVIVLALLAAFLAVVGAPSRHDLETLTANA